MCLFSATAKKKKSTPSCRTEKASRRRMEGRSRLKKHIAEGRARAVRAREVQRQANLEAKWHAGFSFWTGMVSKCEQDHATPVDIRNCSRMFIMSVLEFLLPFRRDVVTLRYGTDGVFAQRHFYEQSGFLCPRALSLFSPSPQEKELGTCSLRRKQSGRICDPAWAGFSCSWLLHCVMSASQQWTKAGVQSSHSERKGADRFDNYENPRTLRLQYFSICFEGYISVEKVWKNVFPNGKNQGIVHTSFLWCFRSLPSAVRQVNVCTGRKGAKVLYCGKVCIGRKGAEEPAAIRCFPLRVRAPVPPVGCPRARCRQGARACCGARACARCGARARLPPGRSAIFIN